MSKPAKNPAAPVCWVVTDGRRGIENQALGLAEAVAAQLDRPLHIERVTVRQDGFVALPPDSQPDLWIGCGRAAIPVARQHGGIFPACTFVYVQDPRRRYDAFDLVIAPEHDRLRRSNAIATIGSPNRISRAALDAGAAQFRDRIDSLPQPRAAVLIGGDSGRFKLTARIADYLEQRIGFLVENRIGVMLTVSRRTPAAVRRRLHARFDDEARVWFHDGEGDNPYFAFLAAADWIFVTEESTNMLVEAAATGTPVYVLPMEGRPGKFSRLHAALEGRDAVRPFLGELERWSYPPLRETERVARLLVARWQPHLLKTPLAGDAGQPILNSPISTEGSA